MGGIISNPPGETGTLPEIPIPNFTQQAQQQAAGYAAAGWWDTLWQKLFEHVAPGLQVVVGVLASFLDTLLAQAMRLMTAMQGTNTPGFYNMVAATVSDLLGVEIGSGSFQNYMQPGTGNAPYMATGQAVLNYLMTEMQNPQTGTPQGGFNAASSWLGYALAFAIREGNVETVVEMLPAWGRFFEGLRGYGINMAHNLGLGRLTHEALRSFMKVMIADPLSYYVNDKFHPTLLGRDEILKAWRRGAINDSTQAQWLSWLGYDPDLTAFLKAISKWIPSDTAVVAGWRLGELAVADYNTQLVARDVDPQDLQLFNLYATFARSEAHLNTAIANYILLLKNRWITEPQFRDQLTALGISDLEIKWAEQEVFPLLNYQTKELTSTEITDAYQAGLIDQDYYTDWMTRWGYAPNDQAILQALFLLKQGELKTTEEINQWKLRIQCLKAIKAGYPATPGFDAKCNPTG